MQNLIEKIQHDGFCFVDAADARLMLGTLADWDSFAASWNDMPLDTYMADGGRFQRELIEGKIKPAA
ncbi:MAG: hypothetical protein ABL931_08935, partial [Usitatibacteraceae bacterium]